MSGFLAKIILGYLKTRLRTPTDKTVPVKNISKIKDLSSSQTNAYWLKDIRPQKFRLLFSGQAIKFLPELNNTNEYMRFSKKAKALFSDGDDFIKNCILKVSSQNGAYLTRKSVVNALKGSSSFFRARLPPLLLFTK